MADDFVLVRLETSCYRIAKTNILRYENSLIAQRLKNDEKLQELVINRAAPCFDVIFDFYTSGNLHMPTTVCPEAFREELAFWRIEESRLSDCCKVKFRSHLHDMKHLRKIQNVVSNGKEDKQRSKWRKKMWDLLEYRSTGVLSKIYYTLSILMVIASIVKIAIFTEGSEHVHLHKDKTGNNTNKASSFNLATPPIPNPTTDSPPISTTPHLPENCTRFPLLRSPVCPNGSSTVPINMQFMYLLYGFCNRDCVSVANVTYACGANCTRGQYTAMKVHILFDQLCSVCYAQIPEFDVTDNILTVPEKKLLHHVCDVECIKLPPYTLKTRKRPTCNSKQAKSAEIHQMFIGICLECEWIYANNVIKNKDPAILEMHRTGRSGRNRKIISDEKSRELSKKPFNEFYIFEYVWAGFFTMEFILQLVSCPKIRHVLTILNIIDLISLAGTWTRCTLFLADVDIAEEYFRFFLNLQVLRIFRLIRCMQHFAVYNVLVYSVQAGVKDLMVILLFISIGTVIFGNLIFFVESYEQFSNIGDAFYWSIITMTTVGYGDVHPETSVGKGVACACALYGLIMLALTLPIFAQTFHRVYDFALYQ